MAFDSTVINRKMAKMMNMIENPPQSRTECSTREAARLLGVSVSTVQMWVDGGELEAWKTVGGHRRVSMTSIERLLRGREGADTPPPAASSARAGLVMLVVEDDLDLLSLYEAVISGWNLPVTLLTASNGYEGLIAVGRARPDLLVTDLNMPGLDGFQLLRTLRADRALDSMQIVVVTGLDAADIDMRGSLPGGVEVLRKPVPFDRLQAVAQTILNGQPTTGAGAADRGQAGNGR